MQQEPEQEVTSTESASASPIDLSPGDQSRVVIVDGKEKYIPQKWEEDLPQPDYTNVKPAHDGREWYEKGADYVAPQPGPAVPDTSEAPAKFFQEAIRAQLVASDAVRTEMFWRTHALAEGMPQFADERKPHSAAFIAKMLKVVVNGNWPTHEDCIPPGSILDTVDKFFFNETDIAREIPFFTVLHYVMAKLMQDGVQIDKRGQMLLPDLYTIIVATSGSGKTMTQKAIAKALGGQVKLFPGADSSIKFAENLQNHRLSFFLSDEFGQFLKDVKSESNMKKVKRYLLKAYDNEDITYQTTATDIVVKDPAISLLGLTALDSFTDCMSAEMFMDGFAQRFCFCVAEKDGRERVGDYNFKAFGAMVSPMWAKIVATPFHKVYYTDEAAMAAFLSAFKILTDLADTLNIGDDFSRRLSFRCHKYALAYHVLTGKKDNMLHTEDYLFAARLAATGLRDLRKVFDLYGMRKIPPTQPAVLHPSGAPATTAGALNAPSAVAHTVSKDKLALVQAYLQKRKAANATPITISKLQSSIRALHGKGGAQDTRSLAEQAVKEDPSLAPFVVIS